MQRILSNIVLYTNAVQPRHFDETSALGQELDSNLCFDFIFDPNLASHPGRLTLKDFSTSETLGDSLTKVEVLYRLLAYTL